MKSKILKIMLCASIYSTVMYASASENVVTLANAPALQDAATEDTDSSAESDYEYEEKDVAVNSSMTYQLMQMFTHETHHHKNIEYDSLYENYKPQILHIISIVLDQSRLSQDEQYNSDAYTVIGEEPIEDDEPLFDCAKARRALIQRVINFINKNEVDVRSKCIGSGLQELTSRVVWAPGCCDLQLHKNCFQQCRKNNVTKCMNLFCTKPDWTYAFYAQVVKNRNSVPVADLYDSACPLCMEPLKVKDVKKKCKTSADETSLVVDNDGTTAGAKHKRFL